MGERLAHFSLILKLNLTAPEAKAALEEFVGFLAELAAVPDADKMTFGEAYKGLSEQRNKPN